MANTMAAMPFAARWTATALRARRPIQASKKRPAEQPAEKASGESNTRQRHH